MKIQTLLGLAVLLVIVSTNGTMDYNLLACDVFTGKFGAAKAGTNGTGLTKLGFSGEVSIVDGTGDAQVKFGYLDDDYYFNTTFFGLVTEDGLKPEQTCLDLRIYKYTNDNFTDPVLVTDLTIGKTSTDSDRYRYYLITFKGSEFTKRLVQTSAAQYYTYTGYYALAYYLSKTEQVQYTHRFKFSIRVNKATQAISDTAFYPLSQQSSLQCANGNDPACPITAVSTLQFCIDSTCAATTTNPNIHLNDNFYVLHKISTPGLQGYLLSDSQVSYVGSGLLKETPVTATYSKGQAIYLIKATLAWDKVTLQATTNLKESRRMLSESSLRILASATADSAQATSVETCLKLEGSDSCPTCEDICQANNGDAPEVCSCKTSGQQILLLAFLLVLLMF